MASCLSTLIKLAAFTCIWWSNMSLNIYFWKPPLGGNTDYRHSNLLKEIGRWKSYVAYFELIAKAMSFVHPLVPCECRLHIERGCCELNFCYWEQGRKRLSLTQKHILCLLLTPHTHTWFPPPLSLSLNILHTPTCMAHSQSFILLFISPLFISSFLFPSHILVMHHPLSLCS